MKVLTHSRHSPLGHWLSQAFKASPKEWWGEHVNSKEIMEIIALPEHVFFFWLTSEKVGLLHYVLVQVNMLH